MRPPAAWPRMRTRPTEKMIENKTVKTALAVLVNSETTERWKIIATGSDRGSDRAFRGYILPRPLQAALRCIRSLKASLAKQLDNLQTRTRERRRRNADGIYHSGRQARDNQDGCHRRRCPC